MANTTEKKIMKKNKIGKLINIKYCVANKRTMMWLCMCCVHVRSIVPTYPQSQTSSTLLNWRRHDDHGTIVVRKATITSTHFRHSQPYFWPRGQQQATALNGYGCWCAFWPRKHRSIFSWCSNAFACVCCEVTNRRTQRGNLILYI